MLFRSSEGCSSSMDVHDHGRTSFMGAHRSWVSIVCGHVWVVGVYGSWVGSLLAVGGRYAWVRGCLVRGRS